MKKSIFKAIATAGVGVLMLAMLASCGNKKNKNPGVEYQYVDKEIVSIVKTSTDGSIDTYTITYSDGSEETFTLENDAQGNQNISGGQDQNGYTPTITIENGRWYLDGIDTGIYVDEVEDHGPSVFEIYKRFYPDFIGDEENWLTYIKKLAGLPYSSQVSAINAFVDENDYFWVVLSDGTEVYVGYVGGTPPADEQTEYVVRFIDYNGAVLKTDIVAEGGMANPPENPIRIGYDFIGWNCDFGYITSNLDIVAQYNIAYNQLCFTYKDNGNGTMTATLTLAGDLHIYGLEFKLDMKTVGLSYGSVEAKNAGVATHYNGDYIKTSYVGETGSNVTGAVTLLEITFDITDANYWISFSLSDIDAFDDVYNDEKITISGNEYVK